MSINYYVSTKYKNLYGKALAGKVSPRTVIKLQCLHCYGWNSAETKLCDNSQCPLFAYRPFQPRKRSTQCLGLSKIKKNGSAYVLPQGKQN